MGFEIQDSSITLEIRGKEYKAHGDNPQFLDWFKSNYQRLQNVSELSAEEIVSLSAEIVTKLLGTEAGQEIFNGFPMSLTNYTTLLAYTVGELISQGVYDNLLATVQTYSSNEIL